MFREFTNAFIRYHRGLYRMPASWKPWLISLLAVNMIAPVFWANQLEAQVVFGVAVLNFISFVILTRYSGFSRLLGLAHLYWIPLICFLWSRLELFPAATAYGFWIRVVIVLNAGSLVLDVINVVRYLHGNRAEMVRDL